MNSETESPRYSEHPTFQLFITTALEVFAFLKDLGFSLDFYGDAVNECSVRFKNSTTGVEILYAMPNPPAVALTRLNDKGHFTPDGYGLKFIILERCPEREIECDLPQSSPKTGFKQLLQAYAEILKEHAADVLEGDFTVFPQLEPHVRREMRRLRRKK